MRKRVLIAGALVLAVAMTGWTGCRRVKMADTQLVRTGSESTETTQVALAGVESLGTTLRMGVGELKLSAGEPSSTTALDAEFNVAPADRMPVLSYSVEGTRGALAITQPGSVDLALGTSENTWVLRVSRDVPTSLSLKLGVGSSDIDLRGVDVTSLEAITGVGEATIDLSGERVRDMTAHVEAGVGEVIIRVPSRAGVRIIGSSDGIGDLSAPGFSRDGADLVNAAWSGSGTKIELSITRGLGDVKIISVD